MPHNNQTQKKISHWNKITLIFLGLLAAFIILEIGMRLGGSFFLSRQEYRNLHAIEQKGAYRIMCLGESTTADAEGHAPYPRQLEEILNQKGIGIRFTVINKGKMATNTGTIVSELQDNLNEYQPDMVITMMGINDKNEYLVTYKDEKASKIRQFFRSSGVYKLLRLIWLKVTYPSTVPEFDGLGLKQEEKVLSPAEVKAKKEEPGNKIHGFVRSLMAQGKYQEAEEALSSYFEKEGMGAGAKIFLDVVFLYEKLGKYKQIEQMYQKAIDSHPEMEWLYCQFAWWYDSQNRHAEAEILYRKAIGIYKNIAEKQSGYDRAYTYGVLAQLYEGLNDRALAEEYYAEATNIRTSKYRAFTFRNYQKLRDIVQRRGIQLVCVQYPVRSVMGLKKMLGLSEGIIFVDNEMIFKKAIQREGYHAYFTDMLGGDFGHCTEKGNRLLAENIADTILKEVFGGR